MTFSKFLSGVPHNFTKKYRVKSPRPSRIPVGVSNNGMNYVSEKSIPLNELMRIKDIYRSHQSDHYMLTPSAINHHGTKINGSTIEVYTPSVPSEIRSFVKYVLPKEPKGIGTKIKNWILFKLCQRKPLHCPGIFAYFVQEFNINPQNSRKVCWNSTENMQYNICKFM